MQKQLLTRLLKAKNTQNKKIEKLIAEFAAQKGKEAREQSKKFLSDLLILILKEHNIPKDELLTITMLKLKNFGFKIDTDEIEDIYMSFAVAATPKSVKFIFDKTDTKTIAMMHQNFFWLKEDASDNLQANIKDVLKDAFEGNLAADQIGYKLREKFGGIVEESENYFQGVSDHILRQSQSIARVKQYKKNNIKYVQIDAVMDNRTSDICRSMNGRVIATKHLIRQADNILEAKSITEKKKASQWRSKPYLGTSARLPADFGLPPYHFRCRTSVKPYMEYSTKIDGVNANGSKLPGEEYDGKKVLFSHVDKTGKEIVITKDWFNKFQKHNIKKRDIIKALNSINRLEKHIEDGTKTVAMSDNGFFIVFVGNKIITIFKPHPKPLLKYFNESIKEGTQRNIIKWLKELFY